MRNRPPLMFMLMVVLGWLCGCVPHVTHQSIVSLRDTFDQVEHQWRQSLGDPQLDEELEDAYLELQGQCRAMVHGDAVMSGEDRSLCEAVEKPYSVRRNELVAEKADLVRSVFELDVPGTLANEYIRWPSQENERKLHRVYSQVTRYMHPRLPWRLYLRKPEFQRSRLSHYLTAWQSLRQALRENETHTGLIDTREHQRLLRRTNYAFTRLKDEMKFNQGLEASRISALTRAETLEAYEVELEREQQAEAARQAAGRKKEVVVFVHGLGNDRGAWNQFPWLLSQEDLTDPSLDRYFRVYNFRYDTRNNVRPIEDFARELEDFLREVRDAEQVEAVNVVAHSMGGVLSLRALLSAARGSLEPESELDLEPSSSVLADRALEAFRHAPKPLIKRLVTLASPYHGDELANVVVKRAVPEPRLYRRFRPLPWRVPFYPTRQTEDLRVGGFHLRSIAWADSEWVLDPAGLIPFLTPERRDALTEQDRLALTKARVPLMAIIALPVGVEPLPLEDDGLVRAYAANPRHRYLVGANADVDIGFKGGSVRYVNTVHVLVKAIGRREDPTFRNVVGFLRDAPPPQETPERFATKRFLALVRGFPADVPLSDRAAAFFQAKPHIAYIGGREYQIPKLEIDWQSPPDVDLWLRTANEDTGTFSQAGTIAERNGTRTLTATLRAAGYKPRQVSIPVTAGQVSYAVQIELEREASPPGPTLPLDATPVVH